MGTSGLGSRGSEPRRFLPRTNSRSLLKQLTQSSPPRTMRRSDLAHLGQKLRPASGPRRSDAAMGGAYRAATATGGRIGSLWVLRALARLTQCVEGAAARDEERG